MSTTMKKNKATMHCYETENHFQRTPQPSKTKIVEFGKSLFAGNDVWRCSSCQVENYCVL